MPPLLKLINHLPAACITNNISSAVNIEMEFVVDALPENGNPFEWMELISLQGKTIFFALENTQNPGRSRQS
jgi:hypothetical protein